MICTLVLAHRSPRQLERLLRTLTEDGDVAVVHLDARVDARPFNEALAVPGVVTVADPVRVMWGGWSIVEATLRAIRTGLDMAPTATHFQLMSGDGFPVRPMREVRDFYEGAGATNFIQLDRFPNPHKPRYRIANYYIEHDPWSDRLTLAYRIANRLMRRTTRGLGGRTVFTGSQWWTLTADATRWVLAVTDSDPALVRFMRHTRVPDEHYVQTLLGNSIFHETIAPPVVYADWRPTGERLPPVLTVGHLDELLTGRYLWARKFNDESDELVHQLQQRWVRASKTEPAMAAAVRKEWIGQSEGRRG